MIFGLFGDSKPKRSASADLDDLDDDDALPDIDAIGLDDDDLDDFDDDDVLDVDFEEV